jgi:exodeoxyribonuclease VII large subunit
MRSDSFEAMTSPAVPDAQIYSVSQLNREASQALEDSLPMLWVEGEISNLARPGSGHIYFSLKDQHAQVRCAMFRGANRTLRVQVDDGLQVLVRAKVTIYEPRGSFQLIVEQMEPAGEGLLRRKLEELKTRLASEGLFDPALKMRLPTVPKRIGIVTSPSGAAIRDILHVLERRFAAVPVIIYPVQVQGAKAKHEIVAALQVAADRNDCDVLIIGRGGGSLEDLWAFNEEIVARAIAACPIPIVSAVGHEVDFTISDLVADLRAPTPSAAAELVVPDAGTWLNAIDSMAQRTASAMRRILQQRRGLLRQLTGRVSRRHPGFILRQNAQRLDELSQRMSTILHHRLAMEKLQLNGTLSRLFAAAPAIQIREKQQHLKEFRLRINGAMRSHVDNAHNRIAVLATGLHAVSPLGTLKRGYAIVSDPATGALIRDANTLAVGQKITGRLALGSFAAEVKKILDK